MQKYIDELYLKQRFDEEKLLCLLNNYSEYKDSLFEKARCLQKKYYDNEVIVRGLIEFTNYCKNNCFYCGIRKDNQNVARYRLSKNDILLCCEQGTRAGIKSFVLQGGEDPGFSTDEIADVVSGIKAAHPDVAVTLSFGEHDKAVYEAWFNAGADRYLLRHETISRTHYKKLHPKSMSLEHRTKCLFDLRDIGYQVGTGFMVGSPYQTFENIVADLKFISRFRPHMVGIGPYIPHDDTPFKGKPPGSVPLTLALIAIIRLLLPEALIPATTAVASLSDCGRESAVLAGANVIMPNLSPIAQRQNYSIYNNKLSTGAEAAEHLEALSRRMEKIGYRLSLERGDSKLKIK